MEKGKVVIGIDPDINQSGVGVVYSDKNVQTYKMEFPKLLDYLRYMNECCKTLKVVIEGGWLNQSNWHVLGKFMSTRKAAAIGRSTGMNHQTGILITEWCKHNGIDCQVIKPLKKCWSGQDGKITQDEIKYFIGDLPRMNQDQRDALLIAWVYAGFTVRVMPKKSINILKKTIGSFDN